MKYGAKFLFLPALLLLVLGIFFTIFTKGVSAQNVNYDVTVSPVFFDLSSNPGQTITDKVRIRNNTTSAIPIKVGVQKLTGDENGDIVIREDSNEESLSWIKFANPSFVASPQEWSDVAFTIQVPKYAAYGYYFALTFTKEGAPGIKQTGATISGASAVPILLNVRAVGAKSQAEIVSFTTKNFISEYLPIDFDVRVENSGNVHVAPHGNVFITDWTGKSAGILEVNATFGNIIPQTQRTFQAGWDDGFLVKEPIVIDGQTVTDDNGNPKTHLSINWNKFTNFRLGKYNANLLLVFDNGQKDVTLEKTIAFWVFPYKALLIILIIILAGAFLIRISLRYYIGKEIRKRTRS